MNPSKTPRYCGVIRRVAKSAIPTNTVNIGVSELRMAATDESICRCAKAKKKEGKKVPKKPVTINHFH